MSQVVEELIRNILEPMIQAFKTVLEKEMDDAADKSLLLLFRLNHFERVSEWLSFNGLDSAASSYWRTVRDAYC